VSTFSNKETITIWKSTAHNGQALYQRMGFAFPKKMKQLTFSVFLETNFPFETIDIRLWS
jgi:hypothetical protein